MRAALNEDNLWQAFDCHGFLGDSHANLLSKSGHEESENLSDFPISQVKVIVTQS